MPDSCVVFVLNSAAGFYSIFFFMCRAYIHAKKMGIPFYIAHMRWPYTYQQGWHDYFTSLTLFDQSKHRHTNAILCSHANMPGIPSYTLGEYVEAIREIYCLRPELLERVKTLRAQLGEDHVGLFVRRGDKLIWEAPYIPTTEIVAHLPPSAPIFLQTDDYTVVEEVQTLYPSRTILSTVPTSKRGSFHSRSHLNQAKPAAGTTPLLEKSLAQIKEETEEMLVGLHVVLSAPQSWTDQTSNVGRFLKLAALETTHIYPVDTPVDLTAEVCPAHCLA